VKIHLSQEDLSSLKRKFKCSESSISDALHFRRSSLLCQKIRTYAMNFFSSACIVDY
jgi:hypothetical protein